MNVPTYGYSKTKDAVQYDPEKLLEEYLPLIRYLAEQMMRRVPASFDVNELIDSGVLGLLEAAQRFDPKKGVQFKTFITYRIRGAMLDCLRVYDWFPRGLRDTSKMLQQAMKTLEQKYGRPAEEEEIAEFLNISLDEYRNRLADVSSMNILYFEDLPISGKDEDEVLNLMDALADESADLPEEQYSILEFTERLAEAIRRLPMREKILLTLYYHEELNMKEVALVLGLTESRVSQLHSQMVLRLRGFLGLDLPGG